MLIYKVCYCLCWWVKLLRSSDRHWFTPFPYFVLNCLHPDMKVVSKTLQMSVFPKVVNCCSNRVAAPNFYSLKVKASAYHVFIFLQLYRWDHPMNAIILSAGIETDGYCKCSNVFLACAQAAVDSAIHIANPTVKCRAPKGNSSKGSVAVFSFAKVSSGLCLGRNSAAALFWLFFRRLWDLTGNGLAYSRDCN